MWITLLVMAAAVSLEPFRVGMTVVLLNRPRPVAQLAAFLCGGFVMGLSVGALVLFVVDSWLPTSPRFALPLVQVVIGVLALVAAVVVAATRARVRPTPAWLARILRRESPWVAGAAGLGIALPSVDYLAALTVIAAAGVEPATRVAAVTMFNVVAFAMVEIALLSYLLAPDRTRSAMTSLDRWIRARRRREVAALLALAGVALLAVGLLGTVGQHVLGPRQQL